MRLAVLFRRIGPYHRVRLDAAGKVGELWCLEGGGVDRLYAWDAVPDAESFRRVTLFRDADSGDMPPRILQRAVFRALSLTAPACVAIPGWEDKLALAALQWCSRNQTPVIMMSDSHELGGRRRGIKEIAKRRVVRRCSAGFVAGSAAADYLVRLGIRRERVFTGYDAVDNQHFAKGAEEARRHAGATGLAKGLLSERHFLCPARFIWEKNLSLLLAAYARYRRLAETSEPATPRKLPWRLVLLGDGPLRSEVEKQISALNLAEFVHLPGFRQYEELPKFYASADAVILPSVSETWGLVVNEALASGLPVLISNRCGCAPDLVRDGQNGYTFDPLNPEEIAQAMLRLSSLDADHLRRMGDVSREIAGRWSPFLFAENLWKAAHTAVESAPLWWTFPDRLLLWALLHLR